MDTFTFLGINSYSIPQLLSSVLFLISGFFVLIQNKKSIINITFALLCWATVLWEFPLFLLLNTQNEIWAGYLVKICYAGITCIPIFFFHFCISFLGEPKRIDKYLLYFSYPLSIIFEFFLIKTNYFIEGYYKYFWGFYPKAGPLHPFYLLLLSLLAIRGIYRLYTSLKKKKLTSPYQYQQVKYVLVAVIFYIFSSIDFLPNYGVKLLYPPGFLFILLSLGIFIYAIVGYRLMDIAWVLSRTGIYILSFLTILFYVLSSFFINQKLGYPTPFSILTPFLVFTSIFLFIYLFSFFEKLASKYFYYSPYNLQRIIRELGKIINQYTELSQLSRLISRSLLDALKLDKIGILLLKREEGKREPSLKFSELIKFKEDNFSLLFEKEERFLIQYLQETKEPLVKEEIPFLIREAEKKKEEIIKQERIKLSSLKEEMEKREIAVLLPLLIEEELIGMIILGNKLSGEAYTVQDLELLTTLTGQASIAFNNALALEEIAERKNFLERMYKATVGRELRMIELKKEIKKGEEKIKELEEQMRR